MTDVTQRARELLADAVRAIYPDDIARRYTLSQLADSTLDMISMPAALRAMAAALRAAPVADASTKGGSDALRRALAEYPSKNTHQMQARKVCAGVLALAESYGAGPKLAIHPPVTLSGKSITRAIVNDHYTPKQPIRFLCYGCHEYVAWLAPDSRCSSCTRLSPDEV